jgi:hypothetical protein
MIDINDDTIAAGLDLPVKPQRSGPEFGETDDLPRSGVGPIHLLGEHVGSLARELSTVLSGKFERCPGRIEYDVAPQRGAGRARVFVWKRAAVHTHQHVRPSRQNVVRRTHRAITAATTDRDRAGRQKNNQKGCLHDSFASDRKKFQFRLNLVGSAQSAQGRDALRLGRGVVVTGPVPHTLCPARLVGKSRRYAKDGEDLPEALRCMGPTLRAKQQ